MSSGSTAAHWVYKESPSAALSAFSCGPSPASLRPGHPVLQIGGDGTLRDAVVTAVEEPGGMRLLVAVSITRRAFKTDSVVVASTQEYRCPGGWGVRLHQRKAWWGWHNGSGRGTSLQPNI